MSDANSDDYEKAIHSGGDVASFEERHRAPLERLHNFLHSYPTAAPLMVLAASLVVFGAIADNFFTPFNFSLIIQQVTVIGVLGIAQTLIILTAGIDLSVAAIMVLSSVVMGRLGVTMGLPTGLAILAGFAVGTACGALNGFLVTRFKLPPFIVTLGTWSVFFALNLWYSDAQTVRSQDIDATAPLLKFFGERVGIMGAQFTYGSFLMLGLFGVFWYVLNWTAWGRAVYAIGDDKEAAELAGIRTDRILLSVYAVGGFVCAVAAWIAIGRLGSISPQSFYEGNLDAITAVVIGGTSLFGGRGAIFGTLIGAITVGVFRSGLKLAGVEVLWQEFTVGVLIIVAVAMDQWIRKVSS
ncbi:ABC transporter permease [Rhodobacteraceae bacterium 2CG4]|uniref:ABC transporter permease n=1 Tax=Halovulum marinum TaxID=2662447 RepID=A0A6L5Z0W5_9RHOB|nr:ABC transporter permease [Halovulum marinum]MSU90128.1 ABC transporter permease [Halovulum marinum]